MSLRSGIVILLLMFFIGTSYPNPTLGESLAIGFQEFPRDLNVFDSDGPAGEFLRRSVTDTLVRPVAKDEDSTLKYKLALADSISVDPEKFVWSFRLRKGLTFHNGEPVNGEDVVFSLKRCIDKGHLPKGTEVSSSSRNSSYGTREYWVEVKSDIRGSLFENSVEAVETFPLYLTKCPIMEKETGALFGVELGIGSNAVSTGEYFIDDFTKGKQISLLRVYMSGATREGAERIVLSGFRDLRQALTALRMGTIDALYSKSYDIIVQAKKDETLESISCSSYNVAYRRGLVISCGEEFRASSLRYAF